MQIKEPQSKTTPPAPPTLKPSEKQEDIAQKLILQLQGFKLDQDSPPQNEFFQQDQNVFQNETQIEDDDVDEEDKHEAGKRSYKEFIEDVGSQHSIAKVLTRLNRKPRKIVLK